jgi:cysteine synthase A
LKSLKGQAIKIREVSPTIAESMLLPDIVKLDKNLYGVVFVVMKLLPAYFILEQARNAQLIEPGSVVIETSSGTFGLALAILCNLYKYRLILVSDPAIEPPLQRRLEDLGAIVDIVSEPAAVGGFQGARLQRMAQRQAEYPIHFWPAQYSNPHNPGSYAYLAELLAETIGRIDCIVGSVGSGGSMCGSTSYLRLLFPHMHSLGVDTHGSVLFGHPDQKKRLLRGLGNSLMPKNLDHTTFDEIHWVNAAEAFAATRALHRQHAVFMGPTSGAAYMVAKWWAEKNPAANVVVLFPDEGYRYQDTVYNDDWLKANNVLLSSQQMTKVPTLYDHPLSTGNTWARVNWQRRSYEQVMGTSFKAETA